MQEDSMPGRQLEEPAGKRGEGHIAGRIDVFIICGLSSAGKDTLLSCAASGFLKGRPVRYLTKHTTRKLRSTEPAAPQLYHGSLPGLVEHVTRETLHSPGKYFGLFARYGNEYGFLRAELATSFAKDGSSWIVAVYSACDTLRDFRDELTTLLEECKEKTRRTWPQREICIYPHWVLIDAPPTDCISRIGRRVLDKEAMAEKRRWNSTDAAILERLRREAFFDCIVANGDSVPLESAMRSLEECLCEMARC